MRLPPDAVIAQEKMRDYLNGGLRTTSHSFWPRQVILSSMHIDWRMTSAINCSSLKQNLKEPLNTVRCTVVGSLIGPNGRTLRVKSIWMIESATKKSKFITLYAAKGD